MIGSVCICRHGDSSSLVPLKWLRDEQGPSRQMTPPEGRPLPAPPPLAGECISHEDDGACPSRHSRNSHVQTASCAPADSAGIV